MHEQLVEVVKKGIVKPVSGLAPASATSSHPPSVCSEPGWRVTFEDDFSGSTLNASNWVAIDNVTHGPTEKQLYLADDVYLRDGLLVLRTRKRRAWYNSTLAYNFTSGWVESKGKRFQAYGRFG